MTVIKTNVYSLSARQALKNLQEQSGKAIERLSSGKRINSAKDDAAGLAIATRLTSEIRGMNMAIRNAGDAQSMVNTAEGAQQEVTNMLQRMRELALQASTETHTSLDRINLNTEVQQLLMEINSVGENTRWSGQKLFEGRSKTYQIGADANQSLTVHFPSLDTSLLGAYQLKSVAEVSVASANHAAAKAGFNTIIDAGADPSIKGKYGTATAAINAGADAKDLAEAINNVSEQTGVSAIAQTRAQLRNFSATGNYSFTLEGKSSTTSTITFNLAATTDVSAAMTAINQVSGSTGITATLRADNEGVNLYNSQGYDIIIGDITGGDVQLQALNNDGTNGSNSIGLTAGGNDSAAALGQVELWSTGAFTVTPAHNNNPFSGAQTALNSSHKQLGETNLATVNGAQQAIQVIDKVLDQISSYRSELGAVSNRLDSTVSNLTNVVVETTTARSQILDADLAKELSSLARAQIMQQVGTAMLAQANADPKSVLKLLLDE